MNDMFPFLSGNQRHHKPGLCFTFRAGDESAFLCIFPLFPTHKLMVCGGGRDPLCRTETSVGERQLGAGGWRSLPSLGDLVSEPTSSISPGTHAWGSRKGLLGINAWIVAGVNEDFPTHLGLRRWRKRIPSRWAWGARLCDHAHIRNTLPCCFLLLTLPGPSPALAPSCP